MNETKEMLKTLLRQAINNAKDDTVDGKKGRWITVKGTHVFIPDGANQEEVVKEFLDKKNQEEKGSSKDTSEGKKGYSLSKEYKKEYEKSKDIDLTKLKLDNPSEGKDKKPQKITKQMEVEHIIDDFYEEPFITENDMNRLNKALGVEITDDELYDLIDKNRDVYPSGQKSDDYSIKDVAKDLQKLAKDKKKLAKEKEKQQKETKKQDLLRYDLKYILKKHSPYADYRYDEEDKTLEVRYWGDWEGDDGSGDYDWQTPTQKTKDKIDQIKKDFKKQFGYDLEVGSGEKNWLYFNIKEDKKDKKIKNGLSEIIKNCKPETDEDLQILEGLKEILEK